MYWKTSTEEGPHQHGDSYQQDALIPHWCNWNKSYHVGGEGCAKPRCFCRCRRVGLQLLKHVSRPGRSYLKRVVTVVVYGHQKKLHGICSTKRDAAEDRCLLIRTGANGGGLACRGVISETITLEPLKLHSKSPFADWPQKAYVRFFPLNVRKCPHHVCRVGATSFSPSQNCNGESNM